MAFEYPTMFLTQTERIFFIRRQRLRRMKAVDISEEESSQEDETQLMDYSEDFPTKEHILRRKNSTSFKSL